MTRALKQYLDKHAEVLAAADKFIKAQFALGRTISCAELAGVVQRATRMRTKEWQARAIVSHAVRNGAFDGAAIKFGVGIVQVERKLRRVA